MYNIKHARYTHDTNMDLIDYGIDVLQSLMEQLCNKHGASMQEGLKWQRGRPSPFSKQWPNVSDRWTNVHANMQTIGPKAKAQKRRHFILTNMTTHGMIGASKNRILTCKIRLQILLVW